MGDKNLNELLKWSIENSVPGDNSNNTQPTDQARSQLTPELMAALMGGPSDADLMKAAMECITSDDPEITLETRLTAFDNLEQLIESLDNANLLSTLGLWTPLLDCLAHTESEIRLMAAWCVGTAVQNNEPCQERLVALGGVQKLVRMAVGERLPLPSDGTAATSTSSATGENKGEEQKDGGGETNEVRRKAVYALSSAVRNYQPAMDVCTAELQKQEPADESRKVDATNMDAVDQVINGLKGKLATKA